MASGTGQSCDQDLGVDFLSLEYYISKAMTTIEYQIEDRNSNMTTGRVDLFDGDPAFPLRARVDHNPYGSVKATNEDASELFISGEGVTKVSISARGGRAPDAAYDPLSRSWKYSLYSGYVATIVTTVPKSETKIRQ